MEIKRQLPKGSHKGRQMSHNQQTGRYVRQRIRTAKNKIASRQAHLANHPNDLQAAVDIPKAQLKDDLR